MITNSSIASLVKQNLAPDVVDYVMRESDFINFLMSRGRIAPNNGANTFTWAINMTTNTSFEVFVENQAATTSGRQGYATATQTPFYGRVVCAVTGHALDQARNGGTIVDPLERELQLATKDIWTGVEGQLLSSTTDRGLAFIVDSTGTCYGIDPSTYTLHSSKENTTGGALSHTILEDIFETQVARGGVITDILCNVNQINNYVALVGPNGSSGLTSYMVPMGPATQGFDVGMMKVQHSYNGCPFTMVRGMTNTEMYFLSLGSPEDFQVREVRGVTVGPPIPGADSTQYELTWGGMLVIKNRYHQSKATGLTA